jgi:glycosyltransferase involved in cell wall biosynthesis
LHFTLWQKEMGVKVANQYNYEFFDWFANPHLPTPDMLIAPSMWNYDVVDQFCRERGIQHVYLHCPVNRQELPFRQIPRARKFIHNAGRAAAHDRNGTMSVIHASSMLRTNAEIVIRFQGQQGLAHQSTDTIEDYQKFAQIVGAKNLTILVSELSNYADSYNDGDVMVLPRRYGGNCLPLNEALSVGMPVLMTDISPNNYLLPKNWLIPSHKVTEFTPRTQVDIYGADPLCLAQKIDEFYRMDEKDMLDENDTANGLADSISWDTLRPEYERVFEELCSQQ